MNEELWLQLRPKDLYELDRNTRTMVLKTKAPKTTMPNKPCTIKFLIDRINKLFNANKEHIQQIRKDRADQEILVQQSLEHEADSLIVFPESPTWDDEPSQTLLVSGQIENGGEVVMYP